MCCYFGGTGREREKNKKRKNGERKRGNRKREENLKCKAEEKARKAEEKERKRRDSQEPEKGRRLRWQIFHQRGQNCLQNHKVKVVHLLLPPILHCPLDMLDQVIYTRELRVSIAVISTLINVAFVFEYMKMT